MMNQAGAGLVRAGTLLFVISVIRAGGAPAVAQGIPLALQLPEAVAAVETETPEAPVADAEPAAAPRLPPDQRLETLKSADLATLKAAQEECLQAAQEYSMRAPELHRQMRAAYENLRQNDPEIQALQQQIADLQALVVQALENHPAVLELQQAIDQAQQDMLAELRLRTTLGGLIVQQGGVDEDSEPPAESAPAEQ